MINETKEALSETKKELSEAKKVLVDAKEERTQANVQQCSSYKTVNLLSDQLEEAQKELKGIKESGVALKESSVPVE